MDQDTQATPATSGGQGEVQGLSAPVDRGAQFGQTGLDASTTQEPKNSAVAAILKSQKQSTGDTADATPISMGQGPNANGAEDSKRQVHAESTMTLGGVTKVLREELVIDPAKAVPEHVVQQGGGGVVKASGEPI